jgi:voltage-gated potassium channel
MIELFTLLRLARSLGSAWRRYPQFRSLVYLVLITLLGGTIFNSLVEGWSVVDALYFSATTLTTVGFGDHVPHTTVGKLFTVFYILAGASIVLGFVETIANETLGRQRSVGHYNEEGQQDEDAPAARGN